MPPYLYLSYGLQYITGCVITRCDTCVGLFRGLQAPLKDIRY